MERAEELREAKSAQRADHQDPRGRSAPDACPVTPGTPVRKGASKYRRSTPQTLRTVAGSSTDAPSGDTHMVSATTNNNVPGGVGHRAASSALSAREEDERQVKRSRQEPPHGDRDGRTRRIRI